VFHHIYIFVSALIMADDVTDTVEAGRYHFFCHRYCSVTFWVEEHGNYDGCLGNLETVAMGWLIEGARRW
jgi:hypothetical protein